MKIREVSLPDFHFSAFRGFFANGARVRIGACASPITNTELNE